MLLGGMAVSSGDLTNKQSVVLTARHNLYVKELVIYVSHIRQISNISPLIFWLLVVSSIVDLFLQNMFFSFPFPLL
jgi:hypothetical protein